MVVVTNLPQPEFSRRTQLVTQVVAFGSIVGCKWAHHVEVSFSSWEILETSISLRKATEIVCVRTQNTKL